MNKLLPIVFVLFLPCTSAYCAWHEASSDHFVVYANQKEQQVREFSERLERYHDAMRWLFQKPVFTPSPSNRVTIYVVSNERAVRKILDGDNKYVGGFYLPRAGGTLAVVPRVSTGRKKATDTERILLHEYAHHYLLGSSSLAYPRWLSEGFAEFYSTASFEKDGGVGLGLPANHRAHELASAVEVPIDVLLDTTAYRAFKSDEYDAFYGRSWLLFHYLQFSQARKGQMVEYFTRLAKGDDEIAAAIGAFGDLETLDKELNRYARARNMSAIVIPGSYLNTGDIRVRKLSDGEAKIMPVLIRSKRGVDQQKAQIVLQDAREVAAKFPNDAAVLAALAEAQVDAGNNVEAIAAAERAIAIDPLQINAQIQKGLALSRMAPDMEDPAAAWTAARHQFVQVNKIENDHPVPLIQYFLSFKSLGKPPTPTAIKGLERALELAPYDQGLRLLNAAQQLEMGRYGTAVRTLQPLVNSPHESELVTQAQTLLMQAQQLVEQNTATGSGGP